MGHARTHARTHTHIVFAHCITLSCGHTLDFLPHQWNVQVFRDYTRIEWQIHDDAARDIFFKIKFFQHHLVQLFGRVLARGASQTLAQWHAWVSLEIYVYLRVVEQGRCLHESWWEYDSKQLKDMCHSCRGESVLCEQRHERSEPDCTGGGGRTYNPRARTQREREGETPRDVRGTK